MDGPLISEVGDHIIRGLPLIGVTVVVLIAARGLLLTTGLRVGDDLLKQENPAAGVVVAAYLLAAAIALTGTHFGGGQQETLSAMARIFIEGVAAIILLRLSIWVNDHFILYRFCTMKEIRDDRNLGAAFCVAGSCLACGLILNGALIGFSQNLAFGLRDIAIYWLLGQATLVLGALAYQRTTRYDVHQLIEYDDNIAVGITFGALLISLGLIVRAALIGAGLDSLNEELPRTLLLALLGTLGVLTVHAVTTLLITTKVNFEDEVEMHGNVAFSIVTASVNVAIAMLLASFLQR